MKKQLKKIGAILVLLSLATGVSALTQNADNNTIFGNASTATTLQTPRAINGVNFDGSAPITVTAAAGTLTGTTLNSTVVTSSLTSVGTLGSLTVTGNILNSALTASQAIFTDASKNLISNAITGTGNVVMSTSPTLITPALGTPSALVGTNITGTATGLTAGNVTTNANLTGVITSVGNATSIASQTGTGTKFVVDTSPTLVTPNLGTPSTLVGTNITGTGASFTSGITNALASATTTVNVSSATAPSSGQVLTATGTTAATWQTPSGGAPKVLISTDYETAGRFNNQVASSGAVSFGQVGAALTIAAVANSSAYSALISTSDATANFNTFNGNPTYTVSANLQKNGLTAPNNSVFWSAIGAPVINASTSTAKHIGFKVIFTGSTGSLFATQADGTTENVSSALLTGLVDDVVLDLSVVVTSGTSATYYYRQGGGTQNSVTLTSNLPTGNIASSGSTYFYSSLSGYTGTPVAYTALLSGSSYSR